MKPHHPGIWSILLYTPYALWMMSCFIVIGLLTAVTVIILPGEINRRRMARLGAWSFFAACGTPPRISGLENVPEGPAVIVANHASYLDGIIIQGVLPPRFGFVIKGEMQSVPLVHMVLRRLGSIFVDRNDPRGSSRDAMRIFRQVARGRCMGFFAEGTFKPEPGLRPFKMGAFITAARLGVPVVPVAIRGSRQILPSKSWWPRWHRLEVEIGEAITAGGRDRSDALKLRDRSRRAILSMIDEPDLEAIHRADSTHREHRQHSGEH
jgi:1-acyl-sn-glycerol-3-phosphate acyltransferase